MFSCKPSIAGYPHFRKPLSRGIPYIGVKQAKLDAKTDLTAWNDMKLGKKTIVCAKPTRRCLGIGYPTKILLSVLSSFSHENMFFCGICPGQQGTQGRDMFTFVPELLVRDCIWVVPCFDSVEAECWSSSSQNMFRMVPSGCMAVELVNFGFESSSLWAIMAISVLYLTSPVWLVYIICYHLLYNPISPWLGWSPVNPGLVVTSGLFQGLPHRNDDIDASVKTAPSSALCFGRKIYTHSAMYGPN